jgi:hypothetical protein
VTLQLAKGHDCVKCGQNDGTTVPCHYAGPWQHRLGKGLSCKVHDIATAYLCHECHAFFDQYKGIKGLKGSPEYELESMRRSEEFLGLTVLSRIADFEDGNLIFQK